MSPVTPAHAFKLDLPEPRTYEEAQAYLKKRVLKQFPPNGFFGGTVTQVLDGLEWDGEFHTGFFYHIRYDDNDKEHMSWEELKQVLQLDARESPKGLEASDAGLSEHHLEGPASGDLTTRLDAAAAGPKWRSRVTLLDEVDEIQPPAKQRRTGKASQERASATEQSQKSHGDNKENYSIPEDGVSDERPRKRAKSSPQVAESPEVIPNSTQQLVEAQANDQLEAGLHEGTFITRKEGRAGHIYEIRVQNFMCHENFQLLFNPHVNLISGQNGSGKSAILQATMCCLGATARNTGRAMNVGQFIRSGCNEAVVKVTIWNTGEEPYKPDIYGNKITVVRKIRKHGLEFSLLDQWGRKQEHTKAALDQMCEHLGINAANPLSAMTQDHARDFLSAQADGKKLHILFMEGTSMMEIEVNLRATEGNLAQTQVKIQILNAEVEGYRSQYTELKKHLDALRKLDSDREMRARIEIAYPWAWVQEGRKRNEIKRQEVEIALPKAIQAIQSLLHDAQQQLEQAKQDLSQKKTELTELKKTVDELAADNAHYVQCESEAQLNSDRWAGEVEAVQRVLQERENERQDLERILQNGNDERSAQYQEQIQELNRKAEAMQSHHQQAQLEADKWRGQFERARDELSACTATRDEKCTELSNLQAELSLLQGQYEATNRSQGNCIFKFGGHAAERLQHLISQRIRQFRRRPVGPVGMLLGLTVHESWAKAVEGAIGLLLDAYICHDAHDSNILRGLMREARCDMRRSSVYTLGFDIPRHNIPARCQPHSDFLTVLRAVRCTDPAVEAVVMNILVDQAGAETVVLADSDNAARDVLYDNSRIAGDMVYRVYVTDGSQWSKSNGAVSKFPNRFPNYPARLSSDVSQQLQQLEEQAQQTRAHVENLQQELHRLQVQCQQMELATNNLRAKQKEAFIRVTKSHSQLQSVIMESQHVTQSMQAEAEAEGRSNVVAQQLAQLTPQIVEAQLALQNAHSKWAEAKKRYAELHERNKSSRDRTAELHEMFNQQVIKMQTAQSEHDKMQAAVQAVQQALAQKEHDLQTAVEDLQKSEADLQTLIDDASTLCDEAEGMESWRFVEDSKRNLLLARLQRDRNGLSDDDLKRKLEYNLVEVMKPESLQKELQRLGHRIADAERNAGGSIEELHLQLEAIQSKYKERNISVKNCTELYLSLCKELQARKENFLELRRVISNRVNQKFSSYMKRKNHTGRVHFDWQNKVLTLEVKVNGKVNENAQAVTDLKQLSGGERSYTTVCFVLALAEFTETPFRCLDEYDVFMDAINRRVATETLLEFAMETPHIQYILITPQDLQAVEEARKQVMKRRKVNLPSSFLKVFKMQPARQNAIRAS